MPTDAPIGFWSYAHDDNRLSGGAILELAHLIAEAFDLLSAEQLRLFVDHDDIAWGDAWRERVNSALAQTTFFIPIITPRYFKQRECRRELLEFAAKAKSLGVDELLLPILYIKPPDFSEESSDEAVALIARTQYTDWQDLRLLEPNSSEVKRSINALAQRLLEVADKVAERQFDIEVSSDLESDGVDGISELVDATMKLLPEWLETVMGSKIYDVQVDATWHQCIAQVAKLQRAHAPASAIMAARMRAAKEMLPLLERHQQDAKVYSARSIQLDPYISALARLVGEHPESYELVLPIRDGIDEAMVNVRRLEEDEENARRGMHTIGDHFIEWSHLGRMFQKCIAIALDGDRTAHEGDAIVRRWDVELGRPAPGTPENGD